MIFASWKDRCVAAVAGALVPAGDYKQCQKLLCRLHEIMASKEVPKAVYEFFDDLSEHELGKESIHWQARLNAGDELALDLPKTDKRKSVLIVAGLIRACDLFISQCVGLVASPSKAMMISGNWYVIPQRARTAWRKADRGQPYLRRGTLYNRIVPREIQGMFVKVETFPGPQRKKDLRLSLGAGLFTNVKLEFAPSTSEGFRVAGIGYDDQDGICDKHFEKSQAGDYFSVVWPELTAPPEFRAKLEGRIAAASGKCAEMFVAGSWHEEIGGDTFNICRVFDRFGVDRVQHRKFTQFRDQKYGNENITFGEELTVIVTDRYLVGIAICKDFCGMNSPSSVYGDLNVDLVLVPSMSTESGMNSHQSAAKVIRHPTGTRTFVVQQMDAVTEKKYPCNGA